MKRNHKIVKQRLDRIVKLMKLGENIGEALYKINKLAKAYGRQGNNIERERNPDRQRLFYNIKDKIVNMVKGKSRGYHIDYFVDYYYDINNKKNIELQINEIYKIVEIDGYLFHIPVGEAKLRHKNKIYKLKRDIEKGRIVTHKDNNGNWINGDLNDIKWLINKINYYKLKTKRNSEIDISIEEEKKLVKLGKLLDKVSTNKLNLNKKG